MSRGSAAVAILGACGAVAMAAWLIPASMQIVSWSSATAGRVGLLAPAAAIKWGVAGALMSAAALWWLGPVDTRPIRAHVISPLNVLWLWAVPFLPWLPDHLPLLVAFAGPVRWLVAAAAVAVSVSRLLPLTRFAGSGVVPGRRTAFVLALLVYLYAGNRSLAMVGLGGDEPHYLVITQSLLLDRDLRIENNHERGDYKAYFGGPLRPDYLVRGTDGAIYSIHAPGLPVLVAPGFALGGAWGALMTICLSGALAALAIFDLATLIGGIGPAWATWAAVCLTVPFVPHAWSIFPEMPAAAITAWALLWMARDGRIEWPAWCWRGICLSVLPWLHTKFTVLLAVLALGLVWRMWLNDRFRSLVAFAVPIVLSVLGWFAFFRIIYGTFDPQAPYGAYTAQFVTLANIPRGLAGSLFDQKFGLFVYAPVYAVSMVGAWWLLRDARWRQIALVSVGLAVVYLLSSVRLYMWWGGSSAPARFLVPVGPLLAPSVAMVFARLRRGLAAAHVWLALAISLFIAVLSLVDMAPPLLYSAPHGVSRLLAWLQGGGPLTAALPTFTEENWRAPLVTLAVWAAAAGLAFGCAALVRRRRHTASVFLPLVVEGVLFVFFVSLATFTYSPDVRAETVQRDRLAMLQQFDPDALRGLDYRSGRLVKLTPDLWLDAGRLVFDLPADADPDPIGRLTDDLSLPPGGYQIGVTFAGGGLRGGDLLAAVGGGQVIARAEGPLGARVVLPLRMPVAVPHLWVQLSEPASARTARRVDIVPTTVVPRRERVDAETRTVESIPHRPDAYIAYVDDEAFPEGGVFWTRGTGSGEVLVAAAGAAQMLLTLHVGPTAGTVHLEIAGERRDISLQANETRPVTFQIPPGAPYVPVRVQASAAFRPSDYESQSTDRRSLGCQVRIEVEGP
jgi:hypothetical protein